MRLIELGLLEPSEIVAGGVEISTLARRNLNLRVHARHGTDWLVKQADPLRGGGAKTLARELGFYAFCDRHPLAGPLRDLIPRARVLRCTPPLLAVEWIDGAHSPWREYGRRPPERFASRLAAELGAALARLHSTFAGSADDEGLGLPRLPRRPADFLSVHRPAPHELRRMSAAQAEIHRLIQSEPAIARELDRACADWRAETLLHGDLRAANLLVLDATERGDRLRLIDWELAKWGDPAWDLGCALADMVHFWVRGLPRDRSLSPARRAAGAHVPLGAMRPAFAALWEAYRSHSESSPEVLGRADLLLRTVRCSAARLIQAAWQRCSATASVAVPERALLQVAVNLLADPVAAGHSLYGLRVQQLAASAGGDAPEARP